MVSSSKISITELSDAELIKRIVMDVKNLASACAVQESGSYDLDYGAGIYAAEDSLAESLGEALRRIKKVGDGE